MRGAERFVRELAGRVRRAGATGPLTLRADSGFWAKRVIGAWQQHGIRFSISVRTGDAGSPRPSPRSPRRAGRPIAYTASGEAQVAETSYRELRLVVRRTRLVGAQAELFPDWRHHAFLTDREGTPIWLDADHRHHAVVRAGYPRPQSRGGCAHCPSGRFFANAAWALVAALAHNLVRWVAAIGLGCARRAGRDDPPALPGPARAPHRSGRRRRLRLPRDWPWATGFLGALERLRAVALRT